MEVFLFSPQISIAPIKMRIVLIAVILALTTVGVSEGKCSKPCTREYEPVCGYDETCNFSAANICMLNVEVCWRQEQNRPPFETFVKGPCPEDKPLCPRSKEDRRL